MKHIDISSGLYASHWGLTDFYKESERTLREALESGEDFDTDGWFGCKKEFQYARYTREGTNFTVSVSCHMDALFEEPDLIYDALWTACHSEEELPEEVISRIIDFAIDDGIRDETELSETIPACEATFERIVEVTDRLVEEAEKENEEHYQRLCDIVKAEYEYLKGVENSSDGAE